MNLAAEDDGSKHIGCVRSVLEVYVDEKAWVCDAKVVRERVQLPSGRDGVLWRWASPLFLS